MNGTDPRSRVSLWESPTTLWSAALVVLLHLFSTSGYGIFRDELYYLACAEHLDWGYVDHPPLVALGAWIIRHFLGSSLLAIRVLPALCAGGMVVLSGAMVRQLGGRGFAEFLACVAVGLAPVYLGLLSIYSMNAFDLFVWSALIFVVLRLLASEDPKYWIWFGLLAGLGLQNKLSVLFLLFGLTVGFVLARRLRDLRTRQLWIGAGLALLIFAPHLIWQMVHGWPTREFVQRAAETKNVDYDPAAFFVEQLMNMNPVTAPLWLLGAGTLLFAPSFRIFRPLGWAYPAILVFMMLQAAKPYYLAPIYPPLFAAGAVTIEAWTGRRRCAWIRPVSLLAVALSGSVLAPLAKPLLSESAYVDYAERLGFAPSTDERKELGRLPQFFADMHGWQELAEAVAVVVRTLPDDERQRLCIYAQNYGQAGAIDWFGPQLGLPKAISGHNAYWMWGPGDCSGEVMILIGGEREDHLRTFEQVEQGGVFDCKDCMPYEDEKVLWIARNLKVDIAEAWAGARHYD